MADNSNVIDINTRKAFSEEEAADMSLEVRQEVGRQVAYMRSLFDSVKDPRDASALISDLTHTRNSIGTTDSLVQPVVKMPMAANDDEGVIAA